MVRWFEPDGSNNSESVDLPWMKDYARKSTIENEVLSVNEVYESPKGLLILTSKCKAFIFKREAMHEYLLEALNAWIEQPDLPSALVVKVTLNGKALLGVDDTKVLSYWVKDGDAYRKKLNTGDGSTNGTNPNPLLPPGSQSMGNPPGTTRTSGGNVAKKNSTSKP